jgi:dihydrodipicolinate synthase/N-acetylneuraminate lyase
VEENNAAAPHVQRNSTEDLYMPIKLQGVMQAPVTPLKDDFSFDADGFAKMVDFHVRHGAPAIAWPHHKAESLNLTIAERKLGAEIAVKTVAGRVPVSIFTGTLSEEDSLDIAKHAQKVGADLILTISPYCRRPSQEEIFDSIVRIATHTDLPMLTYNSPWRNGEGVEFTGELTCDRCSAPLNGAQVTLSQAQAAGIP